VRDLPLDRGQRRLLPLPFPLPWGYHRFYLELPGKIYKALIISAPGRAAGFSAEKGWGVFIPLYALHSKESWGAGSYRDLEGLLDWVEERGGDLVGTLPLLPNFLDQPFDPSPYAPITRLFWSEFYLDVTRVPELALSPEAQQLLNSREVQNLLADLRSSPLVDYRRAMALKSRILEELFRVFVQNEERKQLFRRWLEENPLALDYARFRAAVNKNRVSWEQWPRRQREGVLIPGDYEESRVQYHLYVQWLAWNQMKKLAEKQKLYLDFPLGVHREGFDVWHFRDSFALEASTGAPPDAFFTQGQEWGFPRCIRRESARPGMPILSPPCGIT